MAPPGVPLFRPGARGGPLRIEEQPTALAQEPTPVHSHRDPVAADPDLAKLVVAGDAELLVEKTEPQNNMKLHHNQHHPTRVCCGGHGSMAR